MNVGIELRNARMRKGWSLDEMSRATKIKVPLLHALEDGDVKALPPIVYVLGYLRAYAGEVALDAEDIVPRYVDYLEKEIAQIARTEALEARLAAERAAREVAEREARLVAEREAQLVAEREVKLAAEREARLVAEANIVAAQEARTTTQPESPDSHPPDQPLITADHLHKRFGIPGRLLRSRRLMAAAAVLLAIVTIGSFIADRALDDGPKSARPAAQAQGSRSQRPAATPSNAVAPVSNSVAARAFRVEITPTQPVWVSASADGRSVVSRQMEPGERAVIDVQGRLVLRVSDSASVTWSIDGRPGRSLGAPGQYVTVQITRDTLDQFISE